MQVNDREVKERDRERERVRERVRDRKKIRIVQRKMTISRKG